MTFLPSFSSLPSRSGPELTSVRGSAHPMPRSPVSSRHKGSRACPSTPKSRAFGRTPLFLTRLQRSQGRPLILQESRDGQLPSAPMSATHSLQSAVLLTFSLRTLLHSWERDWKKRENNNCAPQSCQLQVFFLPFYVSSHNLAPVKCKHRRIVSILQREGF